MAKVTGPLMSMSASGSIAGAITFAIWKGRAYVRQLVIPSNPSTPAQILNRLTTGSIAKAARAVLTATKDVLNVGSVFFTTVRDAAPSGQSWISYVQKYGADIESKSVAQWALIDVTEKGYFTTFATAIGLTDYTPILGGAPQVGLLAGQQLLALAFFAKDYTTIDTESVCTNAPTEADVEEFADKVSLTS